MPKSTKDENQGWQAADYLRLLNKSKINHLQQDKNVIFGYYQEEDLKAINESNVSNLQQEKFTGYYPEEDLKSIAGVGKKQEQKSSDTQKTESEISGYYEKEDLKFLAQAYQFQYNLEKRTISIFTPGKNDTLATYSFSDDEQIAPEKKAEEKTQTTEKITYIKTSHTKHGLPIYQFENSETNTVLTLGKINCFPEGASLSYEPEEGSRELAKAFKAMRIDTIYAGDSDHQLRYENDGWVVTIGVIKNKFEEAKNRGIYKTEKEKQAAIDVVRSFCDISSAIIKLKMQQESNINFEIIRQTEGTCFAHGVKISPESASIGTNQSIPIEIFEKMLGMLVGMKLLDSRNARLVYSDYHQAKDLTTPIPDFFKYDPSFSKFKDKLERYYSERLKTKLETKRNYNVPLIGSLFGKNKEGKVRAIDKIIGDSAEAKLSVINKLLECYNGVENVKFTPAEIRAAHRSELGKLINENEKFLPNQFLESERLIKLDSQSIEVDIKQSAKKIDKSQITTIMKKASEIETQMNRLNILNDILGKKNFEDWSIVDSKDLNSFKEINDLIKEIQSLKKFNPTAEKLEEIEKKIKLIEPKLTREVTEKREELEAIKKQKIEKELEANKNKNQLDLEKTKIKEEATENILESEKKSDTEQFKKAVEHEIASAKKLLDSVKEDAQRENQIAIVISHLNLLLVSDSSNKELELVKCKKVLDAIKTSLHSKPMRSQVMFPDVPKNEPEISEKNKKSEKKIKTPVALQTNMKK